MEQVHSMSNEITKIAIPVKWDNEIEIENPFKDSKCKPNLIRSRFYYLIENFQLNNCLIKPSLFSICVQAVHLLRAITDQF